MKVFSVDAETDALYGQHWAIGAVVLDGDTVTAEFKGQIDPSVITDGWVLENIAPVVDLPLYKTRTDLLEAFWQFWLERGGRDGVEAVGDFQTPVEAFLFRECVDLDREARMWLGPYPLHELGTALLFAGIDVDINRREMAGRPEFVQHDPYDDALAAGLCWQKLRGRL